MARLKASLIYLAQPPTLWAATSNSCLYTCPIHVSYCFPKLYLKEEFFVYLLISLFSFYSLFVVVHFNAPWNWFTAWMCNVHLQKMFWKQVGNFTLSHTVHTDWAAMIYLCYYICYMLLLPTDQCATLVSL